MPMPPYSISTVKYLEYGLSVTKRMSVYPYPSGLLTFYSMDHTNGHGVPENWIGGQRRGVVQDTISLCHYPEFMSVEMEGVCAK